MNAWRLAAVGLICLAAAGCRSNPQVAALQRENRVLEDKYYEAEDRASSLESQLKRREEALEKCQRQLREAETPSRTPPSLPGPKPSVSPTTLPPIGSPKPGPEPALELPKVELPSFDEAPKATLPGPAEIAPPGNSHRLDSLDPPQAKSASTSGVVPASATVVESAAESRSVRQVTLHSRLTGGRSFDGRPGDDGLAIFVEPRDARGRIVAAAAPVSIIVLDAGGSPDASRMARWNFTQEEVAKGYRRTSQGEGFHLEVRWPSERPSQGDLRLFVRYTTDDGRHLETEQPLRIALPGAAGLTATRPAWSPNRP